MSAPSEAVEVLLLLWKCFPLGSTIPKEGWI